MTKNNNVFRRMLIATAVSSALAISAPAFAGKKDDNKPYTPQGNCAKLPAERGTEFHGNPEEANLRLGMAGNQWVVFEQVMRNYNMYTGRDPYGTIPDWQANYTLDELREPARKYYIQLIPPGAIRDQIKSGCMLLGNDEEAEPTRNFHPTSIQVDFDVFTSTNYPLMRDLAGNGFLTEALPYTKNQLDLLVLENNPNQIGVPGTNQSGLGTTANAEFDKIFDTVMDLLNAEIPVSQVDHINEGIHRGINNMYRNMDAYIRANAPSQAYVDALDAALANVSVPQPGSPAATRTGITTQFDLSKNGQCNYGASGPLRFCEFAVLNKASTHETRVHHVETPERVRHGESVTGPLWVTEVSYAQASGNPTAVEGVTVPDVVNAPVVYSIAVLATAKNADEARQFVDWIRSPEGQQAYVDGGFGVMTEADLAAGEVYDCDGDGLADQVNANGAVPQTCE